MSKGKKETTFKGVWIPAEIWLDTRLSALEKIILVEIDSLDNGDKGCFANNKHIADFCQCSETTVSRAISKLIDMKYLSKEESGRQRFLKLTLSKRQGRFVKMTREPYQNDKGALSKRQTENNNLSNINENINENIDKIRCDVIARTREEYRSIIKENIDYDCLSESKHIDTGMLDDIVELMTETVCSSSEYPIIAGYKQPSEIVKDRFLKLNSEHIEYVMEGVLNNSRNIRDIKKYLLASLFNAPSTMNSYYSAKFNQDMRCRNGSKRGKT